ncbi:MAG: hypothetical protein CME62_00655 [Halobacteriovoraceae bacterium]|nr:hypothetical protein [Halobacteriovoraceae bacterium]|tara:strand:- start:30180 stop:31046 length:867 start_codon:yes stop_codon:yes gene_type:complete
MEFKEYLSAKDKEILFDEPHTCYLYSEHYQILILKYLELEEDSFEDRFLRFIFFNNAIFVLNEANDLERLHSYEEIFEMFFVKVELLEDYLMEQARQLEVLEDKLYERRVPRAFMDIWFYYKKDISKIERALSRNLQVCQDLLQSNIFDGDEERLIRPVSHFLSLLSRNSQHHIQKLDSLHHYYNSIKGDRMNSSLYLLAIISGVFLPLNLIVGFFGMNSNNMFLSQHQNGTEIILYSIIVVFFTLMLGLPLLKFIDQWILRRFLGRYTFYASLSKKLDDISDKFSVK